MAYTIPFERRTGLVAFERIVQDHFEKASSERNIVFDLSDTEWLGHFPATLIFSWIATLRISQSANVLVKLPATRQRLHPQLAKVLFRQGVADRLREIGADISPWFSAAPTAAGLPLSILPSIDHHRGLLDTSRNRLRDAVSLSTIEQATIDEAFATLLFELSENAFLHSGGSRPHFQLSVSASTGRLNENADESIGIAGVFPPGVRYLELVLGDGGDGIESMLRKHVPENFSAETHRGRKLSTAEATVAYAFEFSSTSNEAGRQQRIEELIKNSSVEPRSVASGLFCVLDFARRRSGQLVVRTPEAILGFDYLNEASPREYQTRAELGLRSAGRRSAARKKLPGTHYWLRIPLLKKPPSNSKEPQGELPLARRRFTFIENIPWPESEEELEDESTLIRRCVDTAYKTMRSPDARDAGNSIVVLPQLQSLTGRASAVLHATIHSLSPQSTPIFWSQDANDLSFRYDPTGEMPSALQLTGDFLLNSFLHVQEYSRPSGTAIKLPDRIFAALSAAYFERIEIQLQSLMRKALVRQDNAAFFFGEYYTEVFFQGNKALQFGSFVSLLAKLLVFRTTKPASGFLPSLIIPTLPTMNDLAREIAMNLNRLVPNSCEHAALAHPVAPINILKEVFARKERRVLFLTDIICTGRTILKMLEPIASAGELCVFCLVDARAGTRPSAPLYFGDSNKSVPVISLLREEIKTHQLRTHFAEESGRKVERIYIVDRITRAASLYIHPLEPQVDIVSLLHGKLRESQALLAGHIVHGGRHFTGFLHLQRLFAEYRTQIVHWIHEQKDLFAKSITSPTSWCLRYLDIDQGLEWLAQCLVLDLRGIDSADLVRREAGDALARQRLVGRDVILVVPTMETGRQTRWFIEWAAEREARSILVLVLVNFMEVSEFNFLQQIASFRNSRLRVRHFMDFAPISGADSAADCPVCKAQREFDALATVAGEVAGEDCYLARSLTARVDRLQPTPAKVLLNNEGASVSGRSVALVELKLRISQLLRRTLDRTQYEAEVDRIFGASSNDRTLLLQLVSFDQPSANSALHPLLQESTTLANIARQSASAFIRDADYSVSISGVAPALCQLVPDEFVEASGSLMLRYADSLRDLEVVCTSLLVMKRFPADIDEIMKLLSDHERKDAWSIVSLAKAVYEKLRDTSIADSDRAFVEVWQLLDVQLTRSSWFNHFLLRLDDALERGYWSAVGNALDLLLKHWRSDVWPLVMKITSSKRWHLLTQGTSAEHSILMLRSAIGEFEQAHSTTPALEAELDVTDRVRESKDRLDLASAALSKFLQRYFASPVHLEMCQYTSADSVDFGFQFSSEVDRMSPEAFCLLAELEVVCDCVLQNWQEASKRSPGGAALFSLSQLDGQVRVKFADNFDGEFKPKSLGGLNTIADYCRKHAARLQMDQPDASGTKSLSIFLQALSKAMKGG